VIPLKIVPFKQESTLKNMYISLVICLLVYYFLAKAVEALFFPTHFKLIFAQIMRISFFRIHFQEPW
jgi:hypothetical protein